MSPAESFSEDLPLSQTERLSAFGGILGAAWTEWRYKGKPSAFVKKPAALASRASKLMHTSAAADLRVAVAELLEARGPLAPRAICIAVKRSHRPVWQAIKFLLRCGAVTVNGRTRGLRYSIDPDWRRRLADASQIELHV